MAQNITLINADVIAGLKSIDKDSIDTVVTSPPYWGLRNYQVDGQIGMESTIEEYHDRLLEVTAELKRVMKPSGVLFWNHGDSYGGSGGSDGDYNAGGLREGQPKVKGSAGTPKCLTMQNERLIMQMIDDQGWILRNRIIWCLSPSTILYVKSQKGIMSMTIHDMVRLDPTTIQLWNGNKWTQVLGWSETPVSDTPVEIVLRSGEHIRCTPEHKFPTERGMISTKELQIGDILKTVVLPQPDKPDTPTYLPDRDIGWFVGIYMAEGSLGDNGTSIQISSHVKEIVRYNRLKRIASYYGATCKMYKTGGNAATINLYSDILISIIKKYIYGNSARNKHLRVSCWNRNNDFLNSVLYGYLEGDGHYDIRNNRWRLDFTRNYAFESDLRTLSARLGISIRINRSIAKIGDKEYPSFRGEIRFNKSSHGNTKCDTEIIAMNKARSGTFWSIGVADEPHVFALASGILTSNSKPNGMPSSARDRFTNKYEPVYMLTKESKYHFDLDAVRVPAKYQEVWSRKGSAPGTPYETTGNNPRARWGLTKHEIATGRTSGSYPDPLHTKSVHPSGMKNPGDVWKIPTQPHKDAHFAIFPDKLVIPMIKAGCPRNGIVLDPFTGSGTTLKVAKELGRSATGIELSEEYCDIIKRNLLFHQHTFGNIINEFIKL